MEFDSVIEKRCIKRLVPFMSILPGDFYIAGNCLNKDTPRDIDLFPRRQNQFDYITDKYSNYIVFKTKNAITLRYKDRGIIQFCHYHHNSLEDLVNSFDFAHVQIGAHIVNDGRINVKEVYHTFDYSEAKMAESTFFTGSKYPLSSLIRLFKYYGRHQLPGKSYIAEALKILKTVIQRGFIDYDDFKDQLDSVDLGLVPEDMEDMKFEELKELFELLKLRKG